VTETVQAGLVVVHAREDRVFPFHVERWSKSDGVTRYRLISRHRSMGAAERVKARLEREAARR
jgi:hypothetical protein